ncbi:MAG: VOC family protein [Planctomycetota bacterium]
MTTESSFQSASAYDGDVLALPVKDLDAVSDWYGTHFGMTEVERSDQPRPRVVLERDGVRIGFEINGGDPSQNGAAIRVNGIDGIKQQLESNGVSIGNARVDERDGESFNVFFVVAPDGLCYYFNEPVNSASV